ncbi:uncharacterized protein LOC111486570 [Cucurbita maxima]|uniref:Uncharacterized protein LOC111486570 n=1 Tax=Cucurbita maxima TaxID=3661 RepID=A0A6J1JK99_CUCMA|nr:uncharacterized protein LOC111486570 [Cucurbita maxima]
MLHMKAEEFVNEYFARALSIANKMKINGENKRDVEVAEKILRSMTPKFDYIVCSIEESKNTTILSIDESQSSLLVHEQRMSSHVEEHPLKITHGEQSGGRSQGRGSLRGRGREQGRQTFNKARVKCYNCHKLGHFQWEYQSKEKEANYAETQEGMLLMTYENMNKANREDTWLLDSGCRIICVGKRNIFQILIEVSEIQ